ncbi:hypothetical protein [Mycobacterium sp.]|nr:hypothetical protein [Mycobacterium sp.]
MRAARWPVGRVVVAAALVLMIAGGLASVVPARPGGLPLDQLRAWWSAHS